MREIILPKAARPFSVVIPESEEVVVLGFLRKGRAFTRKVLRGYFSGDE